MMSSFLLQIETVGPEGHKLLWVLLILLLLGAIAFFWKLPILHFSKRKGLSLQVEKNKRYHPTTIFFKIENNGDQAIDLDQPVIRFKDYLKEKAYKIKGVNTAAIYPLYLEPGKSHELVVALQPFYDHAPVLKNFQRVRVEISYQGTKLKSAYLLLKPGLFRKAKTTS
ncbi:MAG: hypothetical protein JXR22_08970 [Prolixibacteraceae bacterium]|nr:hypothetical protein [Prolixibacteraceae bacterium]